MIDYWLRMAIVAYGMLVFLVVYKELKFDEGLMPIAVASGFSYIISLFIAAIYQLLNLFVGGG